MTRGQILDKILDLNNEVDDLQKEINGFCNKAEAIVDIEDDERMYSYIRCIRKLNKMNKDKKNTYYKITAKSCEGFWVCGKHELVSEIIFWAGEYGRVTVKEVRMSEKEFEKLLKD